MTKPQEEWKEEFKRLLEFKWIVKTGQPIEWLLDDENIKKFTDFISTHFIHRESLKSWLEEQKKKMIENKLPLIDGQIHKDSVKIGHNQAIQSVIEQIEL